MALRGVEAEFRIDVFVTVHLIRAEAMPAESGCVEAVVSLSFVVRCRIVQCLQNRNRRIKPIG